MADKVAFSRRVTNKIAALRRAHRHLRAGEELRHFASLCLLRDDLMEAVADGALEPQRMRLLSETTRQIESTGARLGVFSPAPKAGQAVKPKKTLDQYLNPKGRTT